MQKTDRNTARTNQARPHGDRPPRDGDADRLAPHRTSRRPQAETTEAERPTDEDVDPVRGPENPSDEPRIEDENPDRHSEEP